MITAMVSSTPKLLLLEQAREQVGTTGLTHLLFFLPEEGLR